ncbi:cation diffusion facilitator family transporter [Schleiferilactobacillus perolens]|jgi:cobalt-zinc-cadmium efflux system protein|uniref:cation diffusion facilitator family transporter n=1 Tax=Schleiferilactobacillus perolens TaxID=100468 RepID=UPI0023568C13|nr:cation diffusion facilitator family transporter [Schleiferilactobacillus perolens]MCI1893038.1 cation diffusion facilitator family transporter [Schleiferilactobacillus harbinensis]MCI1913635.1 cation diffusion facilitator family transporter [Schleiferilactobacillus harbinensis]MCI2171181.1 cation diffusion facilitator family transporter [Schleiferilactobacillus perolens]
MAHVHAEPPKDHTAAFKWGIGLNAAFIIIEGGVGLTMGSLALVADAGHNLSDVLGLVISWVAMILSQRAATKKFTYGYKRSSILAALLNAMILLVAIGGIIIEAVQRVQHPAPVSGWSVIIVAAVGVVINGLTAFLFLSGQKNDLNIRGAFLHMAADTAVSVGVVIAGIVMLFTDWYWLDPVISLIIAVIILISTWHLFMDATRLSLDAVPKNIDLDHVKQSLLKMPSVIEIHDLHIWPLSTTENACTVHLVRDTMDGNNAFLERCDRLLTSQYDICHVTTQVELGRLTDESTDHSV